MMTMAEQQRVVSVRAEVVTQEPGHWCMRCCLATGVVAWIAVTLGDRMHLQQRTWCPECQSGAGVLLDEV